MHKLHAPESCGSKSAHIDPSWQTSHFTCLLGPKPKRLGSRCTRDNVSTAVVLIYLDTDAGLPTVPLGLYEINMFFYGQKIFFCKKFCKQHVFLPHHPFCIDGVSADKEAYADVFKRAQQAKAIAKPPQKPEQPKAADTSSKKKRKWTDESQL